MNNEIKALELEGLSKTYGDGTVALRGIDLRRVAGGADHAVVRILEESGRQDDVSDEVDRDQFHGTVIHFRSPPV